MSFSDHFTIPPTSDGRYDAASQTTVVLTGLLCPLTTIAVVLRFLARRRTKASLWWDDWLAVLSLAFFYAYSAICLIAVQNGGGYEDFILLPLPNLVTQLEAAFAAIIVSAVATTSTKITALLLYTRIFYRDKTFRISVIVCGIAVVAWAVSAVTAFALRCQPVYYAWDPLQALGPNCYSLQLLFIATEVPNCLIDFLIVILPIAIIRRLNLRRRDKLMLSFIFLLGGLVGIVSIVRMVEVFRIDGLDFLNISSYWLLGQQAAGILCVCLPTYKPLFPKRGYISSSIRSGYASVVAKISTASRNGRSMKTDEPSNGASTLVNGSPGEGQYPAPIGDGEKPLPLLPLSSFAPSTVGEEACVKVDSVATANSERVLLADSSHAPLHATPVRRAYDVD